MKSDGWPDGKEWVQTTRQRGLVWVCDVRDSTKRLSDPGTVEAAEEYLRRFFFVSRVTVAMFGGHYVKWTGDGFLAWFPVKLHRELGLVAKRAIEAAEHLSLFSNVTQLGVQTADHTFGLRHGISYEQDALVMELEGDLGRMDIIGRNVVQAFRLAGISGPFPTIFASREVRDAIESQPQPTFKFKARHFSREERLKFFKGVAAHARGISTVQRETRKPRTRAGLLRMARGAISNAEAPSRPSTEVLGWSMALERGPAWAKEAHQQYVQFVRDKLLGTNKMVVTELEKSPPRLTPP